MIAGDRSLLKGQKAAFFFTLQELSRHWDRIDVICPKQMETVDRMFFGNVFFHPSPYRLIRQKKWIVQRGQELISIHAHDVITALEYPFFYNGRGALKLRNLTGVPVVCEVHHIVGWPKAASLTEFAGRVMSKVYYPKHLNHFDGIRVVNEEVRSQLTSWGVNPDIIRISPSLYLERDIFRPDRTAKKKYDVSFCGRLVANKGLFTILDAIAELPGVSMLVIGDGPLKKKAEQRAQMLNISDRVHFLGWLKTKYQVAQELAASKIFVMNSTSEGGPRVAVEAMALGLPVVVTKVGVMPDVIKDGKNGFFTDGSVTDLKRCILALWKDPNMAEKMGMTASEIRNKFSREALIRRYATFLKEVAHKQKRWNLIEVIEIDMNKNTRSKIQFGLSN